MKYDFDNSRGKMKDIERNLSRSDIKLNKKIIYII